MALGIGNIVHESVPVDNNEDNNLVNYNIKNKGCEKMGRNS